MEILPESLTFVIAGKWNTYILTKEWVAKNIYMEDQIIVEFSMEPDLPFRYNKNHIRFIPTNNNVTFQALKYDQKILEEIEKKAKNLISLLDKTPIMAFGVNIMYKIVNPSHGLLKLFTTSDKLNEDYKILTTEIKRKITINDQTVLNLTLSLNEDSVVHINFNFHTVTKTSIEFLNYFNQNKDIIINHFSKAKDILDKTYNIKIQQEND